MSFLGTTEKEMAKRAPDLDGWEKYSEWFDLDSFDVLVLDWALVRKSFILMKRWMSASSVDMVVGVLLFTGIGLSSVYLDPAATRRA